MAGPRTHDRNTLLYMANISHGEIVSMAGPKMMWFIMSKHATILVFMHITDKVQERKGLLNHQIYISSNLT